MAFDLWSNLAFFKSLLDKPSKNWHIRIYFFRFSLLFRNNYPLFHPLFSEEDTGYSFLSDSFLYAGSYCLCVVNVVFSNDATSPCLKHVRHKLRNIRCTG